AERANVARVVGGIADITRAPRPMWVLDPNKEHIAVSEAKKLGIPFVAILATNCVPDDVQSPVPGNDDAIRSANLLTSIISSAVEEGRKARAERQAAAAKDAAGDTGKSEADAEAVKAEAAAEEKAESTEA